MRESIVGRQFVSVVVGWICVAGAAFAALWSHDASDDYSGWVIAIVALQIPALVALRARRYTRFGFGRACAFALPAGLTTGFAMLWVSVPIGNAMYPPKFLEFRGLLLALALGVAAMIAGVLYFHRVLRRDDHPRGARLVLTLVTAVGALALLAMITTIHGLNEGAVLWLVISAPVLWTLPLWLLVSLPPPPPIPRANIAR